MEIYHPTINPFLRGPSKIQKISFPQCSSKKTGQYLIEYFPSLSINLTMCFSFFFSSLTLLQFCTDHTGMLSIKPDQTISIVTSILSLAWCFTSYHATLKRGALDKDLASLFYRSVLFLSFLFQVLGRLFIFVLFAYSFG